MAFYMIWTYSNSGALFWTCMELLIMTYFFTNLLFRKTLEVHYSYIWIGSPKDLI